jgi:hypothetical protein
MRYAALGLCYLTLATGCADQSQRRAIDNLNRDVIRLTRENSALKTRVDAAEKLELALVDQLRNIRAVTPGATSAPQVATATPAATPTTPKNEGEHRRGGFTDWSQSPSAVAAFRASEPRQDQHERPKSGPRVIVIGNSDAPSDLATDEQVGANCREKWGTDYRMVKYCSEQQADAKGKLMSRSATTSGVPISTFDEIRSTCREKWPADYRMQDYCETQQLSAYSSLHR